jgi:hypothetical protein
MLPFEDACIIQRDPERRYAPFVNVCYLQVNLLPVVLEINIGAGSWQAVGYFNNSEFAEHPDYEVIPFLRITSSVNVGFSHPAQ